MTVAPHRTAGTEPIDGLRGLAIALVVLYHTWLFSWLTPTLRVFGTAVPIDTFPRVGYLGVDLFFVISGFCLFFPEARAAAGEAQSLTLRAFAYRRFIKIVPSYALALVATAAVAWPALHSAAHLTWPLANHALFINNFFVDDFGQTNSVFWSLAIEVQFYLVFPFLALAARRSPLATFLALVSLAIVYRYATAACCLRVEIVSRQLPAYVDLFAFGMAAAYLFVRRRESAATARARLGATAAAVALVVALFLLMQSANAVQYDPGGRERWDLFGRSLFGATLAGIAFFSCLSVRMWRRIVANPLLVFLSLLSYNLYLWHTLIGIWMRDHRVPPSSLADVHADDAWKPWYVLCTWSASFAVAALTTYFVERPLLATVKPQPFAFDWSRVRATSARPRSHAPSEKRT